MESSQTHVATLRQRAAVTIQQHSQHAYPREACGVLIGSKTAALTKIEIATLAVNLRQGSGEFEIDPGAIVAAELQAESGGLVVVGFWHSHPDAPAVLSERDRAGAWLNALQLVVSVTSASVGSPQIYSAGGELLRIEITP